MSSLHSCEKTRGGWGRGKIEVFFPFLPSFPALPFSLSSAPASVFFFHWCLLKGASAEERGQRALPCLASCVAPVGVACMLGGAGKGNKSSKLITGKNW